MEDRRVWPKTVAAIVVIFGLLTILSGGSTLAGAIDMGAIVPFVLWFNFIAGFLYVAGGLLLWNGSRWAFPVSILILGATLAVFVAFGVHASNGGAFEMRTVGALSIRSVVWTIVAYYAFNVREKRR